MVSEEHLAILLQGVKVWNNWRIKNLQIELDLSGADFSGADLSGADLSGANLSGADLSGAILSKANLIGVNFSGTNLSKTNLNRAILIGAILIGANLIGVNLSGANLSGANLIGVNLSGANLSGANLIGVNLSGANLSWVNLSGANFSGANLSGANLIGAKLIGAKLIGTKLSEADLIGTNLSDADLREANLIGVNLSGANLSGTGLSGANLSGANLSRIQALNTNFTSAKLTGACIEDWHTNSATNLTDVICDYIYLIQEQQERRPSSGNFAPGEFTKLYQKSLDTVDLIFRNGIDWDAFAYSFKKIEVESLGSQLDVQSIEKKGDGVILVRISVSPDANKEKIHADFMQGYEFAHKVLEEQYQSRLEDKDKEINRLFYLVNQLQEKSGKVSIYNQQNSQVAGKIVDAETVQSH
ncbi:pentapeptide repeat-containing protein [Anabaena sphaerica FACHB-251]|uniref:Pentapeptide repeat-containing protein n=1 Tax=Anabaena sphaerica FACHB-251 TaxID=2692883 RepID=A0A927A2H4_9NOST|nr:pentapeptide repeat-containing protein [Anabaena sphaerica]MBD2295388.1 pentapeptide repeat-containing protein [Anabaena sphaerica FACHB-251]